MKQAESTNAEIDGASDILQRKNASFSLARIRAASDAKRRNSVKSSEVKTSNNNVLESPTTTVERRRKASIAHIESDPNIVSRSEGLLVFKDGRSISQSIYERSLSIASEDLVEKQRAKEILKAVNEAVVDACDSGLLDETVKVQAIEKLEKLDSVKDSEIIPAVGENSAIHFAIQRTRRFSDCSVMKGMAVKALKKYVQSESHKPRDISVVEESNDSGPHYELDILQNKSKWSKMEEIDPAIREMFLEPKQFMNLFHMSKSEFKRLPKWKQDNAKREQQLL